MNNKKTLVKNKFTKESAENPTELVKNLIYFLTIYSIFTSIIYLFGYWSIFNFNIFEFIQLTDILKYSIKPLAIALGTMVFLYVYTDILFSNLAIRINELGIKKKPNIPPKIIAFLANFAIRYKAEVVIAIVLFAIYGPEIKWSIVTVLASFPICLAVVKINFVKNFPIRQDLKISIIFLIILFSASSFSRGRGNALLISNGVEFKYISEKHLQSNVSGCKTPLDNLRILAQTNDQTILYNPKDKSIIINKLGYGKSLKIFTFEEPHPLRLPEKYYLEIFNKYIGN